MTIFSIFQNIEKNKITSYHLFIINRYLLIIMKLLIVDDNVEIGDMLKQYLELEDFEVLVINDGKKGLNLIQNETFDKILLDMAMPEFSGLDVLENLKSQFFTGMNKILILTASEIDPEIAAKIKSYGVTQVITKPINMSDLLEKLRK